MLFPKCGCCVKQRVSKLNILQQMENINKSQQFSNYTPHLPSLFRRLWKGRMAHLHARFKVTSLKS